MRAARRRGYAARALTRAPFGDARADTVIGDLNDPDSLVAAAQEGMHAVLQVTTRAEAVMVRQVGAGLDALRHAGVCSIVLKLASASRPAPARISARRRRER